MLKADGRQPDVPELPIFVSAQGTSSKRSREEIRQIMSENPRVMRISGTESCGYQKEMGLSW